MNPATFPALLQLFFAERLLAQQRASAHSVASYRDLFRLLFGFATRNLGKEAIAISM